MKVLKFGGTSVGTVESLGNVKSIVDALDEPAVVIVSALGGLTDKLIATARMAADSDKRFIEEVEGIKGRHRHIMEVLVPENKRTEVFAVAESLLDELESIYKGLYLIKSLPDRTLAEIVSFGERISSLVIAAILDADHADSLEYIKTEKWFGRDIASRSLTDGLIRARFKIPLVKTVVAGGFISRDKDTGEITNLGRGGSDYTAALIAAALGADTLEIWTDVDGFMTADPRLIPTAHVIKEMSFIESMELCSFGAKVIYPPTIYPVFHRNIPIRILNTHNPKAPGTLITDGNTPKDMKVCGVSSVKGTSILRVEGGLATNVAQINTRSYNAMARNGISIFLVAQPDAEAAYSIALPEKDAERGRELLEQEFAPELQSGEVSRIAMERGMSILAVVRDSIKELKGLGQRLINTLQREGVETRALSDGASETTIAIVVAEADSDKALRIIHGACF